MINVKEPPRRFLGHPVVAFHFLEGRWGEVPYQGMIVTLQEDSPQDAPRYNAHHLVCSRKAESWTGSQGWYDLTWKDAEELFHDRVRNHLN